MHQLDGRLRAQLKKDFETAQALLKAGDFDGLVKWLGRNRRERAKKAAKRARE